MWEVFPTFIHRFRGIIPIPYEINSSGRRLIYRNLNAPEKRRSHIFFFTYFCYTSVCFCGLIHSSYNFSNFDKSDPNKMMQIFMIYYAFFLMCSLIGTSYAVCRTPVVLVMILNTITSIQGRARGEWDRQIS